MFTGIIQHVGTVRSVGTVDSGLSLSIDASGWVHPAQPGESIAVNGCCLTLTAASAEGELAFDVIAQTLSVTTLSGLRVGEPVNLEQAVTASTMLGGHIVQGHVDGIGTVDDVWSTKQEHRLRVKPPPVMMNWVIERGSIAVSGVSLTIAAVEGDSFDVALIPTTLELTNLGSLEVGDEVNLEADYIAKIVTNWLERGAFNSRR